MLYSIFIEPIEVLVGWVYSFFINKYAFLGVIGAIYGVSMVINFLALPLYNVADSLQEKERKISKKLEYRVKRIKKGFKGDEQFMMLSEYYRQNNYHPLYVLRSSLSILIEIPFFIAAYHYLSNIEGWKETPYYFLDSLGLPDGLIKFTIGGALISINLLPIIMTLINFISGYFYTKDATLRDKVQLYAMGIFFLIILYNSPSGLVLYWILNNIFSLCKTVALKTKIAKKILLWAIGLNLSIFGIMYLMMVEKTLFGYVLTVLGIIVIASSFIKIKHRKIELSEKTNYMNIVVFSGVCLVLLMGLLIPAATIATSPIEFSYIGETASPIEYIKHGIYVFIGMFIFWPVCISKMFGKRVSAYTGCLLTTILMLGLADAFIFKGNFGVLDSQFFLEKSELLKEYGVIDVIGPIVVIVLSVIAYWMLDRKNRLNGALMITLFSIAAGELTVGLIKTNEIKKGYKEYAASQKKDKERELNSEIKPIYNLSKDGKNVVVLFLDRALGPFMPYALEEVPELREQFAGFTYYPNTVSFSSSTIAAAPAMMAGYEYTPANINKRSEELLVDKHNEASIVMPKLFEDAGYHVTITDPPFPNYKWAGDLVAFEKLNNATVDELTKDYSNQFIAANRIEFDTTPDKTTKKEVVNYSVLRCLPSFMRYSFNSLFRNLSGGLSSLEMNFIDQFSMLYFFRELTNISNSGNQFIFIGNSTTHEPTNLDKSLTFPSKNTDHSDLKYEPVNEVVSIHYQAFIAAMKQIGIWLNFLRDNNVYDNTRIIIVSDHGKAMPINENINGLKACFTTLLMYKDFDSNDEFKTDSTFMTNADTMYLAKEGLGLSNINPYTGNTFFIDKYNGVDAFISNLQTEEARQQKLKTFDTESEIVWHISPGDISKEEIWTRLERIE